MNWKNLRTISYFILIGGLISLSLLSTNDMEKSSYPLPKMQTPSIVKVEDYGGNAWASTVTLKAEIGENLKIIATWSENVFNGQWRVYWNRGQIDESSSALFPAANNNTTQMEYIIPVENSFIPFGSETITIEIIVYAKDLAGTQYNSNYQKYEVFKPAAPTTPSYVDVTTSIQTVSSIKGIKVTWTSFLDNCQVYGYEVYRKSASDGQLVASSNLASCTKFNTTTASFTDTSISQDSSLRYYYGFKAFDRAGNYGILYAINKKLSIDETKPLIISLKIWTNSSTSTLVWNLGDSYDLKNTQNTIYPDGTLNFEIITNEKCSTIGISINNTEQSRKYDKSMAES
jgi:hypothetical protein